MDAPSGSLAQYKPLEAHEFRVSLSSGAERMLEIRSFELADEAEVVALWRECGLLRPWNDPAKDIRRKLSIQSELFLVGLLEGLLVGSVMAGYDGHRGWVNYLAVAPQRRRAGLGRALMTAAEQSLLALGCPKINLQIRETNAEVAAFYGSLGYKLDQVISLGKRLESDDAVHGIGVMQRRVAKNST